MHGDSFAHSPDSRCHSRFLDGVFAARKSSGFGDLQSTLCSNRRWWNERTWYFHILGRWKSRPWGDRHFVAESCKDIVYRRLLLFGVYSWEWSGGNSCQWTFFRPSGRKGKTGTKRNGGALHSSIPESRNIGMRMNSSTRHIWWQETWNGRIGVWRAHQRQCGHFFRSIGCARLAAIVWLWEPDGRRFLIQSSKAVMKK